MEHSANNASQETKTKKKGNWRRNLLQKGTKIAYSAWVFLKTVAAIDDAMRES